MKRTVKRNFVVRFTIGYVLAAAALFGAIALVTHLTGLDHPVAAQDQHSSAVTADAES
jgi:hypothetical protein